MRILQNDYLSTATISITGLSPSTPIDNLKNNIKGDICRVLSGSTTITLTWTELTPVGVVVIPACNFSASAEIKLKAYFSADTSVLTEETPWKFACPGVLLEDWGFSQPLNVNMFSDNNILVATYLSEQRSIRRLEILIQDPENTFLDISKIVIGEYFETRYNANYGTEMGFLDLTENSMAASGDIKSNWGPKKTTMSFNLDWIHQSDRYKVQQMFLAGKNKFMFISLLPEYVDPVLERQSSIYGKMPSISSVRFSNINLYSSQIQIESY